MVISARRSKKKGGPGFTLLELLLTVALLIGLMAAVVFNFAPLQRGASLDEGSRQFEALIRFAGAQAANSGRIVQFRFDETASSTNETTETKPPFRVVREIDPAGQPGVFEDLPEAQPFLSELLERIRIEDVKGAERPANQGTNEMAMTETTTLPKPPITFYPDGSSDTADIIFSSRDPEDFRQMTIHLAGVTGTITSRMKTFDEWAPLEGTEEEKPENAKAPAEQARTEISDQAEKPEQPTASTNTFPNDDWP